MVVVLLKQRDLRELDGTQLEALTVVSEFNFDQFRSLLVLRLLHWEGDCVDGVLVFRVG